MLLRYVKSRQGGSVEEGSVGAANAGGKHGGLAEVSFLYFTFMRKIRGDGRVWIQQSLFRVWAERRGRAHR